MHLSGWEGNVRHFFTPFPIEGQLLSAVEGWKGSLFCVFLRPGKNKESLGALGLPGRAGWEGVSSE